MFKNMNRWNNMSQSRWRSKEAWVSVATLVLFLKNLWAVSVPFLTINMLDLNYNKKCILEHTSVGGVYYGWKY